MSRVVIHPTDSSTDFLKPIYAGWDDTTVVTGGIGQDELKGKIEAADQVALMGHGDPRGLYSVGQFSDAPNYVVDASFAKLLAEKDNLYIWCFANQFVERNQLCGFYTGMFISEPIEALLCGLADCSASQIEASNTAFVNTVSRFVTKGSSVLHEATMLEYGKTAGLNPIAAYNHSRLYVRGHK